MGCKVPNLARAQGRTRPAGEDGLQEVAGARGVLLLDGPARGPAVPGRLKPPPPQLILMVTPYL